MYPIITKNNNSLMKILKNIIPLLIIIATTAACGANNSDKKYTIELTQQEFLKKVTDFKGNPTEWKYLGDKPAIIDFYADWCVYCKKLAPVLEELAKEYADQIYIYKVDTEAEQELAGAFGIRSIPSLLFVPMDGTPQMAMGAMSKSGFKEAIDKVLLKK